MESRPSYATPKKILFSNWMELKLFPFKILNWNLIFLFFSLSSQWKHPFFQDKGWGWLRLKMRMKVSCNDQHPVGPSQRWSSDSHLLSSLGFQHNSEINDFISDPSFASWIELNWMNEWINMILAVFTEEDIWDSSYMLSFMNDWIKLYHRGLLLLFIKKTLSCLVFFLY